MASLLGVNLPYFGDEYSHDMAHNARHPDWSCEFRLVPAHQALALARSLNLEAVRIWLCEGGEGIELDDQGRVSGVKPELLEAIKGIQVGAAIAGVLVYWTLLDANSPIRDGDLLTYSILSDRDQAARFAELVAAPIARILDPAVALGFDVINEPETLTADCADLERSFQVPFVPWETIGFVIDVTRRAIKAEHPSMLVTAGCTITFLQKLWHAGAKLDALDLHVYHADGGLPSRAALVEMIGDPAIETIPLIAGECGILRDAVTEESLANYIYNANKSDYQAVFLWKLYGVLVNANGLRPSLTHAGEAVRVAAANVRASMAAAHG